MQQGHQVLNDCGGASSSKPPLYVVLGGTCLTPAQDKVVQEKAMAIKAEVSIFVATMNKKILGYNNEAFILVSPNALSISIHKNHSFSSVDST